jgi:hypothetical protein
MFAANVDASADRVVFHVAGSYPATNCILELTYIGAFLTGKHEQGEAA